MRTLHDLQLFLRDNSDEVHVNEPPTFRTAQLWFCPEDICLKTEDTLQDLNRKFRPHICMSSAALPYVKIGLLPFQRLTYEKALEKLHTLLWKGVCLEYPTCETEEESQIFCLDFDWNVKKLEFGHDETYIRCFSAGDIFRFQPYCPNETLVFVGNYFSYCFVFIGWD